jgi:hypothetical protein
MQEHPVVVDWSVAGLTPSVALDKPSQVILEIQAGQCPLENARVEVLSMSPEVGFELDGASSLNKDHGAFHTTSNCEVFVRSSDQSSRCPRREYLLGIWPEGRKLSWRYLWQVPRHQSELRWVWYSAKRRLQLPDPYTSMLGPKGRRARHAT